MQHTDRWPRRGVNFGNALDTGGGEPPLRLRESHFDLVRDAGFDTVRLPVRWSAHAGESAPYPIDASFARRVDWAIDQALRRELSVVMDLHHYHELQESPRAHAVRFVALWRQISARYAGWPEQLWFELLNEPRAAMTPQLWNRLLPEALAAVRQTHPDRVVVAGPARMNTIEALPELELPPDPHLVTTVHYYAPFRFTHQGAPWEAGSDEWLGTTWGGEAASGGYDADRRAVRGDLTAAAGWARERGRQLFVGEFGSYERADPASRVRWTAAVRSELDRLGLNWCYWDFGTDFGVFDPARGAWREPLRAALLPPHHP